MSSIPERCPEGHELTPGSYKTGRMPPCSCNPAGEGHAVVYCLACRKEGRLMVYREPPHLGSSWFPVPKAGMRDDPQEEPPGVIQVDERAGVTDRRADPPPPPLERLPRQILDEDDPPPQLSPLQRLWYEIIEVEGAKKALEMQIAEKRREMAAVRGLGPLNDDPRIALYELRQADLWEQGDAEYRAEHSREDAEEIADWGRQLREATRKLLTLQVTQQELIRQVPPDSFDADLLEAERRMAAGAPGARNSRSIPQDVKIAVAKRDGARCVQCGSDVDLHYDHKIPHSRGGSNSVNNIQLLCGDCNRRKGAKHPDE